MAKGIGAPTVSSEPLRTRLKKRGAKAALASAMQIQQAVITNWLKRGIPSGQLIRVAPQIGMTVEQYLREAGVAMPKSLAPTELGEHARNRLDELLLYWPALSNDMQDAIVKMAKASVDAVRAASKVFAAHGATKFTDDETVEKSFYNDAALLSRRKADKVKSR